MKYSGGKSVLLSRLMKGIIVGVSILLIFHFIYMNSSLYYISGKLLKPRYYFMHLNATDLYLEKGEMYHLKLQAVNKRVSFSTTNFRVAGVSFNGRVIGFQPGKAFILAKVDHKVLKCRVHVIDISCSSLKLKAGKSKKLNVRGVYSFVRWESANERVASVNMFGKITAKKKGQTIIYAKVKRKTLQCVVRVI